MPHVTALMGFSNRRLVIGQGMEEDQMKAGVRRTCGSTRSSNDLVAPHPTSAIVATSVPPFPTDKDKLF